MAILNNEPEGITEEQLNIWHFVKFNPLASRTSLKKDLSSGMDLQRGRCC